MIEIYNAINDDVCQTITVEVIQIYFCLVLIGCMAVAASKRNGCIRIDGMTGCFASGKSISIDSVNRHRVTKGSYRGVYIQILSVIKFPVFLKDFIGKSVTVYIHKSYLAITLILGVGIRCTYVHICRTDTKADQRSGTGSVSLRIATAEYTQFIITTIHMVVKKVFVVFLTALDGPDLRSSEQFSVVSRYIIVIVEALHSHFCVLAVQLINRLQ